PPSADARPQVADGGDKAKLECAGKRRAWRLPARDPFHRPALGEFMDELVEVADRASAARSPPPPRDLQPAWRRLRQAVPLLRSAGAARAACWALSSASHVASRGRKGSARASLATVRPSSSRRAA